jgi:hypothetical protein
MSILNRTGSFNLLLPEYYSSSRAWSFVRHRVAMSFTPLCIEEHV